MADEPGTIDQEIERLRRLVPKERRPSVAQLMAHVGVSKGRWYRLMGARVHFSAAELQRLADALGIPFAAALRAVDRAPSLVAFGDEARRPNVVREVPAHWSSDGEAWQPNAALANQIPKRAYDAAIGYLRRLEAAGVDRDHIEEAERLMIDRRYAKANRREKRELSEEDWILLVDDTWDAIREALSWGGVKV